jgi:aryl-alcohol dehydrogenase-like predicted oxidoreductase
MLHKKPFIVPIPGSRKIERIQENLGAADIELTEEEFRPDRGRAGDDRNPRQPPR